VKTGTPSLQVNVLTLRGSPTALTITTAAGNTGTALSIGKFVAGSFTKPCVAERQHQQRRHHLVQLSAPA